MGSLFGSKPQQVGPTQAEIEAASRPYGLMGPTGGITWDYENKMGTATLSPEMAALASRLMGRATTQAGATTAYDPTQAAQQYYQQYVEPDLLQQQQRERLSLESRLLGQGMLGATGGALQLGDLFRAQSAEQRAARGESFTQSQAMLDSMRQRELADIAAAASIYESPATLFQTGAGVGQGIGGIMASYRPTYTQGSSGLLGGLMPALGSYAGSASGSAAITKGLTSLFAMSDSRLKENVVKIGVTDNGLNWYKWDWNDKAKELGVDNHRTIGVMAQEVMNIIPEAVIMADDGYYRVDYSKVV
jgi:hypothetical protein